MSTPPQVYLLCEVAGVVAAVIVTMQQQARSRGSSAPDVLQVSLSVGFWMRVDWVGKPGRYQICTTLHEALYDTTAKHTCLCMCDTQKSIPTLTCSHSPPSRPLGYPQAQGGEDIMQQRAHGTCVAQVQNQLRWGCSWKKVRLLIIVCLHMLVCADTAVW